MNIEPEPLRRPIHEILTARKSAYLIDGVKPQPEDATKSLASLEIKPISEMSDHEYLDLYLKLATQF